WIGDMRNVALVRGHARFVAPKQVEVDGRTLSAEKIFINVGGLAFVPGLPGLEDVPYFTNSSMMDVDFLPEHLVIVGGSYIGLEFAQMYRRFGSSVTVIEMGPRLVGSHVLLAVGRVPNTDDLGLAQAGITTDARGYIVVDDELRTNVPGVSALGDVNGRGAFTHTSYNDYEIVAANLLDGESRRVSQRIPTYALFIDPPLGRAGMTERD